MSLTNALQRDLPAGRLYQSTSMIENFKNGRPDFLEIEDHARLTAVIGHWLHQAMLPYLAGEILFATSIRHPVDRVRSQFRFDMTRRKAGWQPPNATEFLARNRNVICSFLASAFPGIRAEHDSALDAAKTVLSGMDAVFDVPEALANQKALMREIGVSAPSVRVENTTDIADAEIDATEDQILAHVDQDMALYDWFRDRQAGTPGILTNPVHDPAVRARLDAMRQGPRQPELLAVHLARRLARELQVESARPDAMELLLWRRRLFATELYTAFRDARKP